MITFFSFNALNCLHDANFSSYHYFFQKYFFLILRIGYKWYISNMVLQEIDFFSLRNSVNARNFSFLNIAPISWIPLNLIFLYLLGWILVSFINGIPIESLQKLRIKASTSRWRRESKSHQIKRLISCFIRKQWYCHYLLFTSLGNNDIKKEKI